jgi:beta-galactosidase
MILRKDKTRAFAATLKRLRSFVLLAAGSVAMAMAMGVPTAAAGEFKVEDKRFLLDGNPFQIRSGEIHYSRVPAADWRNRIQMAKAMGLNTICTYVFWNYHETAKGQFDFSGEKDVAQFIRICGEEGMKVIVRPGPYVCAEWDLGGIPAWILAERGVKLRTTDARYLGPAKEWVRRIAAMVEPLSVGKGGPVIMVQVENEYGSFANSDREYLRELEKSLRSGGFTGILFTCDGAVPGSLAKGGIRRMTKAVNFGRDASSAFKELARVNPEQPPFTAEFWVGWFDQWQRPHNRGNLREKSADLAWMMEHGASFNLYMFHGGSTRGMWNGANWDGRYRPTTCGYDYDAPLDESGRPTPKYHAFREIIARKLKDGEVPEVPALQKPGRIGTILLEERASLPEGIASEDCGNTLPSMEDAGQGTGFILYSANVTGPVEGTLDLASAKDRVYVSLNGALAGIGGRSTEAGGVAVSIPPGEHRIEFLVENMGRLNYGEMDGERKGLEKLPELAGAKFTDVRFGLIPSDRPPVGKYSKKDDVPRPSGIVLLRGKFECESPADTWLDMRGFGRGVVWLNGRNLGRYWSAGPSQTIFVPSAWIKSEGENEFIVMELEESSCPPRVPTIDRQIWDVRH